MTTIKTFINPFLSRIEYKMATDAYQPRINLNPGSVDCAMAELINWREELKQPQSYHPIYNPAKDRLGFTQLPSVHEGDPKLPDRN